VQASRVKFVFGPEALKVVIGEEEEEFENAFVGGPNEWKYDTFVNWEFWCAVYYLLQLAVNPCIMNPVSTNPCAFGI
jgi:Protein of unknown function (DUF3119)